jgi:hypothetical protein
MSTSALVLRARRANDPGPARPPVSLSWLWTLLPWMLVGAVAAGCGAKAKTITEPVSPALAMPAPPPRVQTPVEDVPLASSPVLTDGPIADIAPAAIAKPVPPRQTAARSEAKPERIPAAAPPVAQDPAPQISTLSAAEQTAELKRIDDHLRTANTNLDRVKVESLSQGNREQYESARQFIDSAVKAKAEQRWSYALTQAEKASKIALELAPR